MWLYWMDWFWGENLNRKPRFLHVFTIEFIGVSCKISHHPILRNISQWMWHNSGFMSIFYSKNFPWFRRFPDSYDFISGMFRHNRFNCCHLRETSRLSMLPSRCSGSQARCSNGLPRKPWVAQRRMRSRSTALHVDLEISWSSQHAEMDIDIMTYKTYKTYGHEHMESIWESSRIGSHLVISQLSWTLKSGWRPLAVAVEDPKMDGNGWSKVVYGFNPWQNSF